MAQPPDDDDDRETTLYHGTTLDAAELIVAKKEFDRRETFFAATRSLAEYFAVRTSEKRSRAQSPAVVRVVLYESDLRLWKRNRWVTPKGFDEGDAAALRGQTQLVFSAEGVRMLNRYMFPGDLGFEALATDR